VEALTACIDYVAERVTGNVKGRLTDDRSDQHRQHEEHQYGRK
jgi:hypothetical protein